MIRRQAVAIIGACAALMTSAWVSAAPGRPGPPSDEPAGEVSCDVDGVTTSYRTEYLTEPVRPAHHVEAVRVSELADTCDTAELSVRLTLTTGATSAGGPITVDDTTEDVPMAEPPLARDVIGVHVELIGGDIPVPAECEDKGMSFARVFSGTVFDDNLAGSNGGDLMFGLGGADRLTGSNGADCLEGGPDDDELRGGNLADVLLGRDGDDRLDGGTHDDHLVGGLGDDVIVGGPGRDTCVGGDGNDQFQGCEVTEQ